MEEVLNVANLTKRYNNFQALGGVNLTVQSGQVFGLLGPNGSGKTTTLGILTGVIERNSGSYSWFQNGEKAANRKEIGTLLETPNFYPYLDAVDNLKIVATIKEIENRDAEIQRVLEHVDLWERRKSKFKTYSLGMKQRLAIASAMLGNPKVLVLDEPTNGLDPKGIAEIRTIINKIAETGKTIIIASHILDEIEKVCTHVGILKDGKIIQQGSLEEIMTQDKLIWIASDNNTKLKEVVETIEKVKLIKIEKDKILIGVDEDITTEQLNKRFVKEGIYLSHLSLHHKNLESKFLEIINQ